MNTYYDTIQDFKSLFVDYLDNIFSVYNRELRIRLEEYNLLSRPNNNIESSTAVGYLLEEFVVAKLSAFTKSKVNTKLLIEPAENPHLSYDCVCDYRSIRFVINIKLNKGAKEANTAVAAVGQLAKDYCADEVKVKSFVVCKIYYDYVKEDKDRVVTIDKYDCYTLEEIDFSGGHKHDNRSWSVGSSNSERLQINAKFRKEHATIPEDVSYERTKEQLLNIIDNK